MGLADAGRPADEERVVGVCRGSRRRRARRRGRSGWTSPITNWSKVYLGLSAVLGAGAARRSARRAGRRGARLGGGARARRRRSTCGPEDAPRRWPAGRAPKRSATQSRVSRGRLRGRGASRRAPATLQRREPDVEERVPDGVAQLCGEDGPDVLERLGVHGRGSGSGGAAFGGRWKRIGRPGGEPARRTLAERIGRRLGLGGGAPDAMPHSAEKSVGGPRTRLCTAAPGRASTAAARYHARRSRPGLSP